MKKINLALLCGGISSEREVSLKGAEGIKNILNKDKYDVTVYDTATQLADIINNQDNIDAAFILLHGKYGEDGTIQGLLELLGIPYQGSGVLGSAIAMDKDASKKNYKNSHISTPKWLTLDKKNKVDTDRIFSKLLPPLIAKPATGGSSIGINIINNKDELLVSINKCFEHDPIVILEEFIKGREITCGILEDKKGALVALPVVEIKPKKQYAFFDYNAKYTSGETEEICPAPISEEATKKAQRYAKTIHKALHLRDYSRTDMILTEKGDIFVLETNTIPGMTPTSLLPLAAKAAGMDFGELLDRLIELALMRKIN